MSEKEVVRALLPKDVVPIKYYIHLTPNLKLFTFHGSERIEVDVKNSTSSITVHSLDIKILSVKFSNSKGQNLESKTITYEEKSESVTFDFGQSLEVGAALLEIEYDGNLNDKMVGFYRSKYFVNGEERYMATSQCEPTGARRAFPGWDEPAHKAVFEITLSAQENLVVLSNMQSVDRKVANGIQTVKFAPTPKMSSYLAAFIVGEFDHVEGKTKEGVTIRVFTPLGKKDQGIFSLDVAIRCLTYYNDYFGIPYPLQKLDMIAIPDFSAGAMENWGLVTYRETALLIDEKNSGIATKQRVAYVVAHELAHQWFGNLVTMEWWKELWLNEGFATFVGNQAVDFMFPEWDIWVQFVSGYFNRAQNLDGLENSHPIEVEVYSSAQIDEIFDDISYSKGACVIRMISDLIGEDKFKKGLNVYLNRFAYKNAVTEDLWVALSEASGFAVKEFMNPFTKVTGYPLVTIESTKKPNEFAVSQNRFFSSGKALTEEEKKQFWWVNIAIVSDAVANLGKTNTTDTKRKPTLHDFKDVSSILHLDNVSEGDWIKANSGQSGFYRVKYSTDLSLKLSHVIEKLAIPAVDRIGIQSDAFALAKAGILSTVEALTLVKSYVNEVDYTVWSDIATNLAKMSSVWSNEPNYADLKKFVKNLFSKIGADLGWEPKPNESALQTLLRSTVLNQLGGNDDESVIQEAKNRFQDQIANNKSISADLRALVYKLVIVNGTQKEYDQIFKIYNESDLHEEKLRALRALGFAQDKELIMRTLSLSLTDQVRSQDIFYVTAVCGSHKAGRELTWNYFKDNFKKFEERLKDSMMLFERVVTSTFDGFTSEEKAREVEEFFKLNPVHSAERGIKQTLETIRANAKWIDSNRDAVAVFLKDQK